MATLGDNIHAMAALVRDIVKQYHLTQSTALRLIDMNLALKQQQTPTAPFPWETEPEEDADVIAAATQPEETDV